MFLFPNCLFVFVISHSLSSRFVVFPSRKNAKDKNASFLFVVLSFVLVLLGAIVRVCVGSFVSNSHLVLIVFTIEHSEFIIPVSNCESLSALGKTWNSYQIPHQTVQKVQIAYTV